MKLLKEDIFDVEETKIDEKEDLYSRINTVFGVDAEKPKKSLRIGIANFGTGVLKEDYYRPKVHLFGLIEGIWFGNHNWSHFRILKEEFPTEKEFEKMDVIILTGSSLSVNDKEPEVETLIELLKAAAEKHTDLRILGFCFGHQVLTKTFDGKVVKKDKVAGLENIQFDEEFIENEDNPDFIKVIRNF